MEPLTPKQEEVIRLMAKGLTNGQIAEHMGITLSGAKWHVSEVLSKYGVSSREEAVALWRQQHSMGARFRGFIGALSLPKLAGGGAAAAGIGGIVLTVIILTTGGSGAGSDPALAVFETPASTVTPTPTPLRFPLLDPFEAMPGEDEFDVLEFADRSIRISARMVGDDYFCVYQDMGAASITSTCMRDRSMIENFDRPIVNTMMQPHPGTRVILRVVTGPAAEALEVVDADGGIHRESTQAISSSPHGLRVVVFDRVLPAKPEAFRAIGHDGTAFTSHGYWANDHAGVLEVAETGRPPDAGYTHAGNGPANSSPFLVDVAPYAAGHWIASYDGDDRFTAALECDTGTTAIIDAQGPLKGADTSVTVEYPEGATVCTWRVETTGLWSFTAQ